MLGKLWVKHAAEHFKMVAKGDPTLVFSLGPRLSGGRDISLQPCVCMAAVEPPVDGPAACEFQMSSVRTQLQDDCVDEDESHINVPTQGYFFFKVVDIKPAGRPVSHNAPRITEYDCMAVQPVDVVMMHVAKKTVEVQLQPASVEDMARFYLLGPSSMSSSDLRTLRQWRMLPTLSYTFGLRPEDRLSEATQRVCSGFINSFRSAAPEDASYVLTHGAEQYPEQLEVLQMLERQGCVHRCHDSPEDWTLTWKGTSRLRCSALLSDASLVCSPRKEVKLEDYSTFELMCQLKADGWVACVLQQRRTQNDCESFVRGGPKHWWVRNNTRNVFRPYLLALLLAPERGWKVKHFQSKRWYECLLQGKVCTPHVRRQTFAMASVGPATEGGPMDVEDGHPRPARAKRKHTAAKSSSSRGSDGSQLSSDSGYGSGSAGSCGSGSAGSGGSGSAGSCGSGSAERLSGSKSGSTSSSSMSGSKRSSCSSSSSSSSSSDDTSSGVVAGAMLAEAASEPTAASADALLSSGTWWRDVQFQTVVKAGEPCSAYQVTCYIASHNTSLRCTRTRNFRTYAGPSNVERMLKLWSLTGHEAWCNSHADHQSVPDTPADQLPTLQALDTMEIVQKPMTGAVLKKRRRA